MARTSDARRASGTGVAVSPRAIVRGWTGQGPQVDVVFDQRTAYDFVVSLKVAADRDSDLLPEDAAWLERAVRDLPADERAGLDTYFGEASLGIPHSLPAVLVDRPDVTDAAATVAALRSMPRTELAGLLLGGVLRHVNMEELAGSVVAGDAQAFESACEPLDEAKRQQLANFVENRDTEMDRLLGVLDAWLPRYQEVEERVARMLERDIADRRVDRPDRTDVVDLIERTTGGLRWFPEAGVRRVIMAPTYFGRPYNYIFQGADWRLFAYPLAESALGPVDASIPPQAVVRLYRALGDTTRMHVLRLLSERDWYLTELAQQLELSKPTMKHHLALLRSAGLVTVTEEGSLTYYSLRRERLREAGVELQHYIG